MDSSGSDENTDKPPDQSNEPNCCDVESPKQQRKPRGKRSEDAGREKVPCPVCSK